MHGLWICERDEFWYQWNQWTIIDTNSVYNLCEFKPQKKCVAKREFCFNVIVTVCLINGGFITDLILLQENSSFMSMVHRDFEILLKTTSIDYSHFDAKFSSFIVGSFDLFYLLKSTFRLYHRSKQCKHCLVLSIYCQKCLNNYFLFDRNSWSGTLLI